jgi:hypothetical protein
MTRNRRTLRNLLLVIVAGAALTAIGAPAQAQNIDTFVSAAQLTGQQQQQVKEFVAKHAPDLAKDPADIERGRDQILGPLSRPNVSVNFRQTMAGELLPELKKLVADQRDQVAANALLIAGETATSTTVNLLLEAMNDPRPPVRFAATSGLARAFAQATRTAPAINADDMRRAVQALGGFLGSQTDPFLADGSVLALTAACRADSMKEVVGLAVSELAKGASQRAQAMAPGKADPQQVVMLTRAATTLRDAVARSVVSGAVPQNAKNDCAALAGDLIAAVSRVAKSDASGAKDLAPLASLSETLLILVADELLGKKLQPMGLGQKLQGGDMTGFQADLEKLFGQGGLMREMKFPEGRFKP